MEIKFDKFEEQIFLITVLIEDLTDGEAGTGFFIQKRVDEQRAKYLLFSNKHVFWGKKDKNNPEAKKEIQFTIHKKGSDDKVDLSQVHRIRIKLDRRQATGEGYYEHPDSDVDVACINISEIFNGPQIVPLLRAIELPTFTDFAFPDLFCGMRVLFVGYPEGFFDLANFLPVIRAGTISSIPSINFNGRRQVSIDADVLPGSSGSPVFIELKGQYKLLGIISEAPIRPVLQTELSSGKASTSIFIRVKKFFRRKVTSIRFIGFGLLYRSDTIKEVYDLV